MRETAIYPVVLVAVTVVTNGTAEQILGDQAADQATSPTHPVSIQEENHSPEWLGMQVSPPVKNPAVADTEGEVGVPKPR